MKTIKNSNLKASIMKLNRNNIFIQKKNEIRKAVNSLMNSKAIREKMVERLELSIVKVV